MSLTVFFDVASFAPFSPITSGVVPSTVILNSTDGTDLYEALTTAVPAFDAVTTPFTTFTHLAGLASVTSHFTP